MTIPTRSDTSKLAPKSSAWRWRSTSASHFRTFAAEIRKRPVGGMRSNRWRWHLDEMFVKINDEMHVLWRAVDHEGEILQSFVTKARDKKAALKFLRKTMRKHGQSEVIVTDRLRSHGAAQREAGSANRQETGQWLNTRTENSHPAFRQRKRAMLRFRWMRSLKKFAAVDTSVSNHFNQERNHSGRNLFKLNRTAALAKWRNSCVVQRAASLSQQRLVRITLAAPRQVMSIARTWFGRIPPGPQHGRRT